MLRACTCGLIYGNMAAACSRLCIVLQIKDLWNDVRSRRCLPEETPNAYIYSELMCDSVNHEL